ncbi:MAG: thiaminase II [Chloroflexi bacterium]|nr:thiaminase II [Chloroflexota bacterium]
MSERISDQLHQLAEPIWRAQHAHSFVRGIGDGTLAVERFAYWVRQDYLFLLDYARLLAVVAARAPELEAMNRYIALAHATLHVEMDLHRSYAAQFGITREQLESEQASPATLGYVNFLLRTALLGSYAETLAALLPCMWGYCEIGQRLAAQPQPADARYAEWIAMYSSAEFAQLSDESRELVDRAAQDQPAAELRRMEQAFIMSSRYELLFWDAAWRQEHWAIEPLMERL